MTDPLRQFFDIMVAAGLNPPAWEVWSAHARDNAELWPIEKAGAMIGGVFFKGQTVHIAVRPDWHGRWISPTLRRAYDTWTHDCPITTAIRPDNQAAIALATRLGFKFKADQGLYHLFEKEPTPCRT